MANFSDPSGDYNPYAPPAPTADAATSLSDDDDVVVLAERGMRFWGSILDSILLALSILPGTLISTALDNQDGALSLVILGAGPLALLCFQWYLVSVSGQSIAKRWLRMKIVRMDGSPPGFVSGVLLRSWIACALQMIPFVGGFIGLIDAVMIFGDQRRCLHDHLAGTKVIEVTRA